MLIGKWIKKGDGDSFLVELRDVKRKVSDDILSILEFYVNEVMFGKIC